MFLVNLKWLHIESRSLASPHNFSFDIVAQQMMFEVSGAGGSTWSKASVCVLFESEAVPIWWSSLRHKQTQLPISCLENNRISTRRKTQRCVHTFILQVLHQASHLVCHCMCPFLFFCSHKSKSGSISWGYVRLCVCWIAATNSSCAATANSTVCALTTVQSPDLKPHFKSNNHKNVHVMLHSQNIWYGFLKSF